MRVLLIEDDSATAQSIELMLKSGELQPLHDRSRRGRESILVRSMTTISFLLDLNLPDMSGFDVLRSLRASKVKAPILMF